MKYNIYAVAEYGKKIQIELPDDYSEKQIREEVVNAATSELEKLPTEIDVNWAYEWDNVQSGGIYSDYFKEDE